MGLNRDFIGYEIGPEEHLIDKYEVMAFASSIGAKHIDSIKNNIVSPTFPVTYELPLVYKLLSDAGLHGGEEQLKKNMLMMVHADQQMNFYTPLMPGDKITYSAKIDGIEDRGSGELLKITVLSTHKNGTKMTESQWGLFIRGIGSGQRPARRKKSLQHNKPDEAIISKRIKVPIDITYKYSKASNDMNPIHLDNEVAKKAGLNGIIVHGMCTLSIAMQAIIEAYLDNNSSRLLSLGTRFSAPVYPGDDLVLQGWEDRDGLLNYDLTRTTDSVKVLKDGTAGIRR